MAAYAETNVSLPDCALEALAAVSARMDLSRDATVRRLLEDYVARQQSVGDQDSRLTHISTVLRYPPERSPGRPRAARPLRLRAPAPLLEEARTLSLILPGQYQRSHRHYQARALTDAVMTAIAIAEPFTDAYLDGLLPLLRQRAAVGLWQLAVASTSTRPEMALLAAAHEVRSQFAWASPDLTVTSESERLLLAAEALEGEVAWHAPQRFKVAAYFARDLLTGPDSAAGERLLYEQGDAWQDVYMDAFYADRDARDNGSEGTTGFDFTGRGGAAVWRAHRQVDRQYFEDWLLDRSDSDVERVSDAARWQLRTPCGWRAVAPVLTSDGLLPEPFARWVDEGRVLCFPCRNRKALWPLTRRPSSARFDLVPGAAPLVAASAGLPPGKVSGFIEAVLVDWNHQFDDESIVRIALDLPVDKACDFGFITTEEMHKAMAQAREDTLGTMDAVIEEFEHDGELSQESLQRLREERGHAREFGRLARRLDRRLGAKFFVTRATWQWPGHSVADALLAGSQPALVQWLATWSYRSSTEVLEQCMYEATRQAFARYGFRM